MGEKPSRTRLRSRREGETDRAALESLLARDLDWIHGQVRRRLGAALRARLESTDVVQEVVVEFLRNGARLVPDRAAFRRLAARVVENVIGHQIERLTAQRRELHRERPLPEEDVLDLDLRRGAGTTPSAEVQRRERAACVRLGLELLDARDREAILLREWEGLSLAEMGTRLGITEDAARMRHHRAVRRLARKVRVLRFPAEALDG